MGALGQSTRVFQILPLPLQFRVRVYLKNVWIRRPFLVRLVLRFLVAGFLAILAKNAFQQLFEERDTLRALLAGPGLFHHTIYQPLSLRETPFDHIGSKEAGLDDTVLRIARGEPLKLRGLIRKTAPWRSRLGFAPRHENRSEPFLRQLPNRASKLLGPGPGSYLCDL